MDFGCVYKGYCSDITRQWSWTPAPAGEIYAIVPAQLAGVEGIRPEFPAASGCSGPRYYCRQGLWGAVCHGMGHGVGLAIHESPVLLLAARIFLSRTTSLSVEIGIYIPDWGGVRIEDMLIVKEALAPQSNIFPKEPLK